jgi:hypothetical protein
MGLPATTSARLLLVFLNGIKQSREGDFEIRDRYVRFTFKIMAQDQLSIVGLGHVGLEGALDLWEFETRVPYCYEPHEWFDPTDFHDPAVKKLEAPPATVTQL